MKNFENELFEFLQNKGLILLNPDTGKTIRAGGVDKDWQVADNSQEKEYSTLKGAIKSAES